MWEGLCFHFWSFILGKDHVCIAHSPGGLNCSNPHPWLEPGGWCRKASFLVIRLKQKGDDVLVDPDACQSKLVRPWMRTSISYNTSCLPSILMDISWSALISYFYLWEGYQRLALGGKKQNCFPWWSPANHAWSRTMVPPIVQEALQELVDHTFKRVLTRDRVPDDVGVPIGHPGLRQLLCSGWFIGYVQFICGYWVILDTNPLNIAL